MRGCLFYFFAFGAHIFIEEDVDRHTLSSALLLVTTPMATENAFKDVRADIVLFYFAD